MRKKGFLITSFVLISAIAALYFYTVSASRTAVSIVAPENMGEIYNLNFQFNKTTTSAINCYVPKYTPSNFETVNYYSNLFGITENFQEDDEAYYLSNENAELTIYKHINSIHYTNTAPPR